MGLKASQEKNTRMFADDTNIFVADKCENTVYETANKVLEFVYRYMKCNLLHINKI